ncbi:murein biosynthesis integral membrane protein MurJ [Thiopseudomonas alkaliphila]|uniref:murein biosynthesis integral membrane protein MurJ n=1 Tax=Thiopseudomonas alkaliphila TaxID=1697053 RepID=UPI0025786A93|nr:murein biosynthesis integral membrane protein MurJ [Thiopseudomonas alkaliphila]MDM1716044.1 murein biosynthesis integral membrane protein MurJ [Thiopseudomonas alkaliphila]
MSEAIKQPASSAKGSGLLRSSAIVSVMTLLSRVLGMVRDMVVAGYFGSSAAADAFFVAFRIPNFLRRLFAEGAFAQAFVPVLSEYRTKRSLAEVKQLVDRTAGTLGLILTALTALGVVLSPYIIMLFAPGFRGEPAKMQLAGELLQITFPYLMLISLTAFCGGILNSYGRFAVPAVTPVLLNISMIGSTLFLTPYFAEPIMALAWGVFIAGVAQLLFQMPFLWKIRLLPSPKVVRKDEGVKRILTLMLPALFGVGVSQINLLLDTVLASFLETGSVSWLYYADRLSELPLGAFGIAVGTVILPALSRHHASDNPKEFSATIDWALRMVLLVGGPAALALGFLAEPLIATLFLYGAMTPGAVTQSALALQAYSLGVLTFMLIKVLAPGFFARQDMKTPVRIAIICMVANMVFNLILIWPLKHVGLAMATSMSSVLNTGLLLWGLYKAKVFIPQPGWSKFVLQLIVACAAMLAVILWLNQPSAQWFAWGWQQRTVQVSILVVAGITTFVIALALMGLRPRDLRR